MQTAQFQLHAEIEQRHWWFVARRRILRDLVAGVLPPSRETTILDVGCGTGANLADLAGDYRCVGIDTSAEAIELAQRRFPEVRFLTGFAPAGVPAEILAATRLMLMTDVLEHVPDDYALLSEMLAAVEPGAYCLVTVPADPSLWSPHDESFGHYRRYRLADFEALWAGLPVEPLLVSYFNSRLYPVVKSIRWWNRLRRQSAGAVGTDFSLPSRPVNRLLSEVFAGEGQQLADLASGRRRRGYRRGVSLVALLRRENGPLMPRYKPASAVADLYDPSQSRDSRAAIG